MLQKMQVKYLEYLFRGYWELNVVGQSNLKIHAKYLFDEWKHMEFHRTWNQSTDITTEISLTI